MNKIKTLLTAPILTNSGYAQHAKMIFQSLIEDPLFDVYVDPLNWRAVQLDIRKISIN